MFAIIVCMLYEKNCFERIRHIHSTPCIWGVRYAYLTLPDYIEFPPSVRGVRHAYFTFAYYISHAAWYRGLSKGRSVFMHTLPCVLSSIRIKYSPTTLLCAVGRGMTRSMRGAGVNTPRQSSKEKVARPFDHITRSINPYLKRSGF